MNERIFITAGGSGHRLNTVQGIPKSLAMLPDRTSVIARQLKQIRECTGSQLIPITICTGYRVDLMSVFRYDSCITYDPDSPAGILSCIKQILNEYVLESYTFILGDTVWHPDALSEALERRRDKPVSCCGNRIEVPCETYMITISGQGIALIKELLDRDRFETRQRVTLVKVKDFSVETGTWWLLEQWMNHDKFDWDRYKSRMVSDHPVDDFDIDEQYHEVWKQFEDGIYNDRP